MGGIAAIGIPTRVQDQHPGRNGTQGNLVGDAMGTLAAATERDDTPTQLVPWTGPLPAGIGSRRPVHTRPEGIDIARRIRRDHHCSLSACLCPQTGEAPLCPQPRGCVLSMRPKPLFGKKQFAGSAGRSAPFERKRKAPICEIGARGKGGEVALLGCPARCVCLSRWVCFCPCALSRFPSESRTSHSEVPNGSTSNESQECRNYASV
jgi:hypothetical protein